LEEKGGTFILDVGGRWEVMFLVEEAVLTLSVV
jgi:hypothetical protein